MKTYDPLYNGMNNNNGYTNYPYNDLVVGNNVDMHLQKNDCDIRADLTVSRVNSVRIWGIVKDYDGLPIGNALIKLVKPLNKNGIIEYESVSFTVSDCSGFYQIDLPANDCESKYKILVSKACIGNQRILCNDNNCRPCNPEPMCPPQQPSPIAQPCQPPKNNNGSINQYNPNVEKRSPGYSCEPVHSQFYGELSNKGNIFKKTE